MKPNPSNQAPPIEAVESLDNGEHSAIDITAVDKNLWQVSTSFSPKDNNKEAIPLKLREIKQKISQQFNHPEKLLKYRHLKKKQVMEDGQLYVKFEIERIPIPEGPPTLSFGAMISDNGEEYADMICMIDLFPLDESGKQLGGSFRFAKATGNTWTTKGPEETTTVRASFSNTPCPRPHPRPRGNSTIWPRIPERPQTCSSRSPKNAVSCKPS